MAAARIGAVEGALLPRHMYRKQGIGVPPRMSVDSEHRNVGFLGRDGRPGFNALHKAITRKEVDLVAAWSVDRLGRSLPDLVTFLGELHGKGVDLYLHQQGIDTTTPAGKIIFLIIGVFAEFERSMIQERIHAGLRRARANGKALGRPKH